MNKIFPLFAALCLAQATQAQLYISPGAHLYLSGNAYISLQNMDLVNDGTLSAPANGRVIFNGTASNEISGTVPPDFAELEIAKTGSGLLALQTDIDVAGKIVFTSNLIDLNNHNIDLGSTGMLEGEDEDSHITGITGGEVLLSATLDAPSAANPGNLGAVITSTQNLGPTIIQRGHVPQTTSGGGGISIQRYFDILPTNNTALNATLRFNYLDVEKNTLDENTFRIWRSEDNVNWTDLNYTSRDAIANYVELKGIAAFSRWTLTPEGALPVTGMELSGIWKNNVAQLKWRTLTEYHNSHFTIERKYRDDFDFSIIGRKDSKHADGNSLSPTTYSWLDNANNNKGPIQYRLQQHDIDGKSTYSNTIVIKPEPAHLFIEKVFPSIAVKSKVYIQTGSRTVEKMQVSIYDMKGRLILKTQLTYQAQWLHLPEMSAGNYKLFIRSGQYHWEGSFVKE